MAVKINGGALEFDAIINGSQFKAQIDAIERQLKGLTVTAQRESKEIENLAKNAATAVGTYLSVAGATNFIQKMIQVRGEFQQLEVSFKTMLKSKSEADKLLAQAVELAAKTPFQLSDVGTGAKQLLAYGFSADQVIGTLKTLGDVASGVSAPLGDIVYLYGTLRTQGRAYTKDIMQFTSRGIPIIDELAKQFGVSAQKVQELVEAGKVGFPEVEKAFKAMTGQGGLFFNLMEEQSKTLTGQISNLEDAFAQMLNNLGKSQEGLFSASIQSLTYLVENYETVLDIIKVLIVTYGTYRAALIVTNALEALRVIQLNLQAAGVSRLTVAELLHYAALEATTRAQKILNATMLSNPYVAIATILAGLTTSLLLMKDQTLKVKTSQELLADATQKSASSLSEQEGKINAYVSVLRNANSTEKERLVAYQKLRDINPVLVKGINARSVAQGQLTKNVTEYIASLREKLRLEAKEAAAGESFKQEQALQERIDKLKKIREEGSAQYRDERARKQFQDANQYQIDQVTKKLEQQRKITEGLLGSQIKQQAVQADTAKKTNDQLIDEAQSLEQIKAIRDEIEKSYKASTEDKERLQLTKDLEAADRRIKELDPYSRQKASIKEVQKEVSKLTELLKDLADAEGDASRSGLIRDESEVSRINARYDELVKRAKELQSKGIMVPGAVFERIESARKTETGNARTRQEVEDYQKVITAQKDIFKDFQEYQLQVGLEKARQVYQEQVGNATSYVQYLRTELEKLAGNTSVAANLKREALAIAITGAEKEEIQTTLNQYKQVILATLTYEQQKYIITQKYQADRTLLIKKGLSDQAAERDKQYKQDIDALNDANVQQLKAYRDLFGDIDDLGTDAIKTLIRIWTGPDGMLEQLVKAGKLSEEEVKKIKKQINSAMDEVNDRNTEKLQVISQIVSSLGDSLGDTNSELAETINGFGDLLSSISQIPQLFKESSTEFDKVSTAVQGVVTLIGLVVSASARRKIAEQQFNDGLINQQREYNLALQDAILLNTKLRENVFIVDYQGQLKDGIEAITSAQKSYQEAIKALKNGQAIAGQRNAVSGSAVLSGAGAGALAGAAIGSIVPVIGTAIGGVVGAIAGAIVGLFGGKKKKDVYVGLLEQYPDLVKQTADGVLEINEELAKTLIANGRVSAATKSLIQDTLDWQEAVKKANQQITDIISNLAGELGSDLRKSLVTAFQDGTDSAEAFAASVEKTLNNVLSQLLFNEVFGAAFDKLQETMKDSFKAGGDMEWGDDLAGFFSQYAGLTGKFNEELEKAKKEAEKFGLDLFKNPNDNSSDDNSLAGAIKGMTAQQADLLAGQFGGLRLTGVQQLQVMNQSLNVLNRIEVNTQQLYDVVSRLRSIETNGIKLLK